MDSVYYLVQHRRKTGQTLIAVGMFHQGHDDNLLLVLQVVDEAAVGLENGYLGQTVGI